MESHDTSAYIPLCHHAFPVNHIVIFINVIFVVLILPATQTFLRDRCERAVNHKVNLFDFVN